MRVSISILLGACVAPQPPPAPWIPLFDGATLGAFESTQFGGDGDIWIEDGAIMLGFGQPLTGVTWTGEFPTCDYELALDAARVAGTDFFCGLTFPVADSHCSLVLGGWGGSLTGLSNIDGSDASDNETTQFIRYELGRSYAVRIRVTARRIEAWLDDRRIIDVDLTGRAVSIRPEVDPSRPLGIASFATDAAIRNVRWRPTCP